MKILQNKKKAASRARRRAENHDEMKSQHKQTVAAYRARKKNEDHDGMKKQHNQTNAAYRERKRNEDHEAMKLQHRQWNQTLRKVENEEHRLKAFRRSIMYGPIFVCISCHMKLFRIGVVEFTEFAINNCISDINVTTKVVTENSPKA